MKGPGAAGTRPVTVPPPTDRPGQVDQVRGPSAVRPEVRRRHVMVPLQGRLGRQDEVLYRWAVMIHRGLF